MTERTTDVMNELAELTAELNRHDLALGELAQAEQDQIREAREARARVRHNPGGATSGTRGSRAPPRRRCGVRRARP
jgi:hypothetical protein